MRETKVRRKRDTDIPMWREKEESLGCNEKDKEEKFNGERDGLSSKEEKRRIERGWSTLRVIKSRPSRLPL